MGDPGGCAPGRRVGYGDAVRPRSCARCGDLRPATRVAFHVLPKLGPTIARGRAFDVCERHVRAGETACRRPSSLDPLNRNGPACVAVLVVVLLFLFA